MKTPLSAEAKGLRDLIRNDKHAVTKLVSNLLTYESSQTQKLADQVNELRKHLKSMNDPVLAKNTRVLGEQINNLHGEGLVELPEKEKA